LPPNGLPLGFFGCFIHYTFVLDKSQAILSANTLINIVNCPRQKRKTKMGTSTNYWNTRKTRETKFPNSYEYKSSSPKNSKSIHTLANSKNWRII